MWLLALLACVHRGPDRALSDLPESEAPPGAVSGADVLAAAADAEEPGVRARAIAIAIAADPAPAGGSWGGRGVFDPEGWVSANAVRALAPRVATEPETRALLREMVTWEAGDPYARAQAGWLLRADPESADALRAAWRAAPDGWARAPLALAAAQVDPAAAEALLTAVRSGEIGLEPAFFELLGDADVPGLVEAAREGAARADDLVAVPWAAMRLDLGDGSAEPVLREALAASNDMGALSLLDALVSVDGGLADGLLRRARMSDDALVRWYAEILLAVRTGDDLAVLLRAMEDDDREVRELAARHLRDLGAVAAQRRLARFAAPIVRLGLVDRDAAVRAETARSAAALRVRDPGLVALLADPSERVRVEAAATPR